jgi:hypothetical protein
MAKYEYGRIMRLAQSLDLAGIAPDISAQILQGGEDIHQSTSPKDKAAWMGAAMRRMDELLDEPTRHELRESCACCLGGKREKLVKEIAKNYTTLEERIRAANDCRFVFGHSVTLQEDGRVLVAFGPEGAPTYRCPCLPQAAEPLPITYCYCCGGHVKHHLQIALGRKLACAVRSTILSSGGKTTCSFLFSFVD